jgi:hypothetical protein
MEDHLTEFVREFPSQTRLFIEESFAREVKALVQDARLINWMFSSSDEGLMF